MTTRYAATRAELADLFSAWGEPRYRVDQLIDGLYEPGSRARSRSHSNR